MRNQFASFEQPDKNTLTLLAKEAKTWLNSTEGGEIFSHFEGMVSDTLSKEQRPPHWKGPPLSPKNRPPPLLVYLSADSAMVKAALKVYLFKDTQGMGMTVLDWVCLPLADTVLAWRRGSVSHRAASTFLFSAARASDSRSRTSLDTNSHTDSDSRGQGRFQVKNKNPL